MPVPWRHVSFPITFESSEWAAAVGRASRKLTQLSLKISRVATMFTNPSAPEFSDLTALSVVYRQAPSSEPCSFVSQTQEHLPEVALPVPEPPKMAVDFDILEQRPAWPFKRHTKVKLGRIAWRGTFRQHSTDQHGPQAHVRHSVRGGRSSEHFLSRNSGTSPTVRRTILNSTPTSLTEFGLITRSPTAPVTPRLRV